MPQSPQSGILQEVAVTTKECGRGGRLRLGSLHPLKGSSKFEASQLLLKLVGLGHWHDGSSAISLLFRCKEELSCKKCKKPDVAGQKRKKKILKEW